jgi:hypothetical protein
VLHLGRGHRGQRIVLTFNEALDPSSAQNPIHYTLTVSGKRRKGSRPVPLTSLAYTPGLNEVI